MYWCVWLTATKADSDQIDELVEDDVSVSIVLSWCSMYICIIIYVYNYVCAWMGVNVGVALCIIQVHVCLNILST